MTYKQTNTYENKRYALGWTRKSYSRYPNIKIKILEGCCKYRHLSPGTTLYKFSRREPKCFWRLFCRFTGVTVETNCATCKHRDKLVILYFCPDFLDQIDYYPICGELSKTASALPHSFSSNILSVWGTKEPLFIHVKLKSVACIVNQVTKDWAQ